MSAPTIAYDVRWRIAGDAQDWTVERFPVAEAFDLASGLIRGTLYEVEIRSVAPSGKTSAWVNTTITGDSTTVEVPATNREGALALPNATNLGSVWDYDTEVEYNATDAMATINFLGGTLKAEGKSIVYGPSHADIEVEPEEEFMLYMWLDDPWRAGGVVQLEVSRNYLDSVAGPGYVALAPIKITAPAIGGTSSGGGTIGGGGGGGGAGNRPYQELV